METIAAQLDKAFRTAIRTAFGVEADPLIGAAQNEKFGDYQSNAAMGLAKQQKSNPRSVAEQIKAKLDLSGIATEVSIAGPGFINVRLDPQWLSNQLQSVSRDDRLGSPAAVSPQTVVVDYSGPNVAKQMHVGHLRSTIIGDAISRVIEFQGHKVIRQNHIGDWGTQFGMLIAYMMTEGGKIDAAAAIQRHEKKSNGDFKLEDRSILADLEVFYRNAKALFDTSESFQKLSRILVVKLQAHESTILELWKDILNESREHFVDVYKRLSVKLEPGHEVGESFYNRFLGEIVSELKSKGLAIDSQGATAVFIDGPDKPPVIVEKTGGGFLYATTDLAALRYRANELHANRIIYTHDSRQAQHFDQVFRIARAAGFVGPDVQLDYAPFGTMLGEDGKPFKTRSGDTVKLKDLLDEAEERAMKLVTEKNPELPEDQRTAIAKAIGIGAVKYSDLAKDRVSDYAFSWDRAMAMDGNTAPYLQYAYARIRSIFRKAGVEPSSLTGAALSLESPHETALAKHILRLGEVIELVARELKPHHLCGYLYELATRFSSFYENCPVLKSEEPTRSSRLLLCHVTAKAMAQGLELLGIEHPEQM
jgi:arginyl-tRNA synthetase